MLLLPIDKEIAGKNLKWYRGDSEEKFKQNISEGKIPRYGPEDVHYKFNSLGYRCQEITPKSDKYFRVGLYGCSLMEGYGLPEKNTIPAQFSDLLCSEIEKPVEDYNFGKAAASNDLIANIVLGTVPVLKPDLVVVYWTYLSRRSIYANNGAVLKWITHWKEWGDDVPKMHVPLYEAHEVLNTNQNNVDNFIKNYMLVKYYLQAQNIPMVWGLANGKWFPNVAHCMDSKDLHSYASVDLESNMIDHARDVEHPGPGSAIRIAKEFCRTFMRNRGESIDLG